MMFLVVAVVLPTLAVAPSVQAASTQVAYTTPEIYGVSASIGLDVKYDPAAMIVRPGSVTAITFAPGPSPMQLIVNLLRLLDAANASVDSSITAAVNDSAAILGIAEPWNITVHVTDTPIGAYQVASLVVFSAPGVTVFLDVNLVGQVHGSVSADSGSLNRSFLEWMGWGGEEVSFTAPAESRVSIITASFSYLVSCAFSVRFSIPGVTDLLTAVGLPVDFAVASFPLGEAPFAQPAAVRVETVDVDGFLLRQATLESSLAAEQAHSAAVSTELASTKALLQSQATLDASIAAEQAHSAALSGELNVTKAQLGATNTSLAESRSDLAIAESLASGSLSLPLVGALAVAGIGGGTAVGWLAGRRRKA
jgi:hypothetical protein